MRLDEGDVGVGSFRLDDDGLKFGKIAGGAEIVFQIFEGDAQAFGDAGKIFVDENGIVAQEQER